MEKTAVSRSMLKIPSILRKVIIGSPSIKFFNKMSPLTKMRLSAGRGLLEKELGMYKDFIGSDVYKVLKDKALIGASAGAALGAGSLGWSLAKEEPETESRLAKLITALLFLPEDERDILAPRTTNETSALTHAISEMPKIEDQDFSWEE